MDDVDLIDYQKAFVDVCQNISPSTAEREMNLKSDQC